MLRILLLIMKKSVTSSSALFLYANLKYAILQFKHLSSDSASNLESEKYTLLDLYSGY